MDVPALGLCDGGRIGRLMLPRCFASNTASWPRPQGTDACGREPPTPPSPSLPPPLPSSTLPGPFPFVEGAYGGAVAVVAGVDLGRRTVGGTGCLPTWACSRLPASTNDGMEIRKGAGRKRESGRSFFMVKRAMKRAAGLCAARSWSRGQRGICRKLGFPEPQWEPLL
jgi:hypothetical protein